MIIDVNLGAEVEGGFELCRELRARSAQLPIIFLTARESELDAVSGLRLGADDYLTKRVSLEHLLARVAALFRRVEALRSSDADGERLEQGSLALDRDRMTAQWRGHAVPLTLTEFWVVHALAQHPGHVKQPRAAHGGGERRARRRHGHVAGEKDPREVPRRRPGVRRDPNRLRHGVPLAGRLSSDSRARPASIDAELSAFI